MSTFAFIEISHSCDCVNIQFQYLSFIYLRCKFAEGDIFQFTSLTLSLSECCFVEILVVVHLNANKTTFSQQLVNWTKPEDSGKIPWDFKERKNSFRLSLA